MLVPDPAPLSAVMPPKSCQSKATPALLTSLACPALDSCPAFVPPLLSFLPSPRHIVVVDESNYARGMITRRDLAHAAGSRLSRWAGRGVEDVPGRPGGTAALQPRGHDAMHAAPSQSPCMC